MKVEMEESLAIDTAANTLTDVGLHVAILLGQVACRPMYPDLAPRSALLFLDVSRNSCVSLSLSDSLQRCRGSGTFACQVRSFVVLFEETVQMTSLIAHSGTMVLARRLLVIR